jgi:hypothetical protein
MNHDDTYYKAVQSFKFDLEVRRPRPRVPDLAGSGLSTTLSGRCSERAKAGIARKFALCGVRASFNCACTMFACTRELIVHADVNQ